MASRNLCVLHRIRCFSPRPRSFHRSNCDRNVSIGRAAVASRYLCVLHRVRPLCRGRIRVAEVVNRRCCGCEYAKSVSCAGGDQWRRARTDMRCLRSKNCIDGSRLACGDGAACLFRGQVRVRVDNGADDRDSRHIISLIVRLGGGGAVGTGSISASGARCWADGPSGSSEAVFRSRSRGGRMARAVAGAAAAMARVDGARPIGAAVVLGPIRAGPASRVQACSPGIGKGRSVGA